MTTSSARRRVAMLLRNGRGRTCNLTALRRTPQRAPYTNQSRLYPFGRRAQVDELWFGIPERREGD